MIDTVVPFAPLPDQRKHNLYLQIHMDSVTLITYIRDSAHAAFI
jgi:hypothetical protein